MTLANAELEKEYCIKEICTEDDELAGFLFTLGCYSGEKLSVVSRKKNNMVLSIKDARYSIDMELAKAIVI